MTCLGYGFVNWWFWMIVSNNPQITQKCFGLRTYLETICKNSVNLRLHHPQGLFTWECKRCQWIWLVIYVGLSMGAPVNCRFTALSFGVMISKPTTFQRHGNGLSRLLCQIHKKDQKRGNYLLLIIQWQLLNPSSSTELPRPNLLNSAQAVLQPCLAYVY